MSGPLLLDLFCCQGGAASGYAWAGFRVVGVDIEPQPRYPFEFHQGDAVDFVRRHGREFDFIHASPPCQAHSRATSISGDRLSHPCFIEPVRAVLRSLGVPYVIENVPGAPLNDPVVLCGASFGLPLRRHRLFECSFALLTPACACRVLPARFPSAHRVGGSPSRFVACYGGTRYRGDLARRREVMSMPWANLHGVNQAIPPEYTRFIGSEWLARSRGQACAA